MKEFTSSLRSNFFISEEGFKQERSLYLSHDQPLGQFLPEMHSIVDASDEPLMDTHGCPLPSCIVMEKGEALDLWTKSTGEGIDMVTGLQVCYQSHAAVNEGSHCAIARSAIPVLCALLCLMHSFDKIHRW
jgi:hypothetical protein